MALPKGGWHFERGAVVFCSNMISYEEEMAEELILRLKKVIRNFGQKFRVDNNNSEISVVVEIFFRGRHMRSLPRATL